VSFPAVDALADTHCHLDFNLFNEDREQVLERARQAGLLHILNPGIDLASSRLAQKLAETYDSVCAAVGVHPNDSLTWEEASPTGGGTLQALRELAARPKVVAIGEIGLDYYRERAPHAVQQAVFRRQLDLAAELALPVVVHNRQASADVLRILAEWQSGLAKSGSPLADRPGVLHSYAGDLVTARQAISLGFLIGITGPVTFKNALDLQKVVSALPLESLLIETDAPFLTPHPHRGQRNEPAYVRMVAEKIAFLHNRPVSVVAETTSANASRLFNW